MGIRPVEWTPGLILRQHTFKAPFKALQMSHSLVNIIFQMLEDYARYIPENRMSGYRYHGGGGKRRCTNIPVR